MSAMSGFILMVLAIVVLVIALEPARRRANDLPQVNRGDRDAERVRAELATRDPDPRGVRRVTRLLAKAGSAVPMHRGAADRRASLTDS